MPHDRAQLDAAFEALVVENRDRVFRVALSILGPGHEQEAEDVAQEVFVKAHRRWSRFRGESAPSTWLHRIAVNTAIEKTRLARLRKPHVSDVVLNQLKSDSDPHSNVAASETRRAVMSCLAKVPDTYRSALTLHYWMDHTVAEIAEILGVPTGTIKARLSRGRSLLGRCLEQKGIHHDR